MIKLSIEEYCEHCPSFEVEQSTSYAKTLDNEIILIEHVVTCKNNDKCKRIRHYLERYEINDQKG